MTPRHSRLALGSLASLAFLAATLLNGPASAEENRVTFPANLEKLVHYTTVKRGNVTEHLLTSQAALDAVKKGQAVPNGTHVVLVDYRDAKVFRYFVMEKREGWGNDYEPARRTGDWQFQHFKADKTVNMSETTARCQSCHQGREDRQHLFTFSDLQNFKK
jgi:hypothetical protein